MPILAVIIAILTGLVPFIDFLVGGPGDRRLKQSLVDFYVVIGTGDWTALYRYPARALLDFMRRWLGSPGSVIRYFLATSIISITLTAVLFFLSMTLSILYALHETQCEVPTLAQFLRIPVVMGRELIIYIVLINIIFDYIAWSLTQRALQILIDSREWKAVLVISTMIAAAVLMLFIIYTIYLPLSLFVQLPFRPSFAAFFQIMWANVETNWHLFSLPHSLFHISCNRGYPVFSITYVGTMQILALETMLPIVLLVISTVFGLFIYFSQPITQRPLSFIVERLESSPRHVVVLIGSFIMGVLALVALNT